MGISNIEWGEVSKSFFSSCQKENYTRQLNRQQRLLHAIATREKGQNSVWVQLPKTKGWSDFKNLGGGEGEGIGER